jgi:subtilisin family serine protease
VAVIDTGVDATHPDLAGQVLPEYDVINRTTLATATDPNGHGTHVAGTIAADAGNGIGISGIAPDAKILPIRVLGANGSGYMSDAATGITYAADHGATVINMSLGSASKVTAVTNAIAYARSKGVTVVAAAGNDRQSGSPTSYPGADQGVIAVAATDSNDVVASYSNAGSYVDVAAPGSNILSTTGGTYQSWNGTSMASPHVAAIAALLEAYNPRLTPDEVEAAIEGSAVDLGPAGKDNDYG